MHQEQHNLLTRPDTFFGVCQGLGEDFHIHPNLLRVTLAGMLFWSPPVAIGSYAVAGLLVAVSRWLAPAPASAAPVEAEAVQADDAHETADVALAA